MIILKDDEIMNAAGGYSAQDIIDAVNDLIDRLLQ